MPKADSWPIGPSLGSSQHEKVGIRFRLHADKCPVMVTGGRYLSDVWTLDLDSLAWSQVSTTAAPEEAVGGGTAEASNKEEEALLPPPMVPIAGHALAMWGESILCIGGHTKVSAFWLASLMQASFR